MLRVNFYSTLHPSEADVYFPFTGTPTRRCVFIFTFEVRFKFAAKTQFSLLNLVLIQQLSPTASTIGHFKQFVTGLIFS